MSIHSLIGDPSIKEAGASSVASLVVILKCTLVRRNGCVVAVNAGRLATNSALVTTKDRAVIDSDTPPMTDVVVVYQTSIGALLSSP